MHAYCDGYSYESVLAVSGPYKEENDTVCDGKNKNRRYFGIKKLQDVHFPYSVLNKSKRKGKGGLDTDNGRNPVPQEGPSKYQDPEQDQEQEP